MNLKRASLPPTPAQIFDKNAIKASDDITSTAASNRIPQPLIEQRRRTYPFDTQPHRSAIERSYTPTQYLFCTTDSLAVECNVDHMYGIHDMFIPDRDILQDVEGLLPIFSTYLTPNSDEYLPCTKPAATMKELLAT
ncbi:hypothetical protein BDR22DRAFT_825123 [Usnea florida]